MLANDSGVGMNEPPIINAFSASSELSARQTDIIDTSVNDIIEAPANSKIVRQRRIRWSSAAATPVR